MMLGQDHAQAQSSTPAAKPAEAAAASPFAGSLYAAIGRDGSPQAIAQFLAMTGNPVLVAEAFTILQRAMGNTVTQQVHHELAKADPKFADPRGAGNAELAGAMLVSNNPEGLATPGVIMTAKVPAGPLAAYVHHSNHTHAPMDMFVVIKPDSGAPVTADVSGLSAADHDPRRLHGGGTDQWKGDPNTLVAVANEAKPGDANAKLVGHQHAVAAKPTAIPIGKIPGLKPGQTDAPLFDARYDVTLSSAAEIAIVAEPPSAAAQAATETKLATGNTKYEEAGSNGRAAGVYTGAEFVDKEALDVSKLPRKVPLTGSKGSNTQLSPGASQQMQVHPASAEMLKEAYAAKTIDHAMAIVLDQGFRIATAWMTEIGMWDGTTVKVPDKASVADYKVLVDQLRAALVKDKASKDTSLAHTQQVMRDHHDVGATKDAASYGTKFDLTFAVHNDTAAASKLDLAFISDTHHLGDDKHAEVFMGSVSVDGIEHAIESTSAAGHRAATELGKVPAIAPKATKSVHVAFESPGQASAGQELDIKKA